MEKPVIAARIDLRTLAQLALFWNNRRLLPATLSELIDSSLEALANLVSHKHPIKKVETISEALRVLTACEYHVPQQASSSRSIFRALQKESIAEYKEEERENANRSGESSSEAVSTGESRESGDSSNSNDNG